MLLVLVQGVIASEGHPHDGSHRWLKSAFLLDQPCTLAQVGGTGCMGAVHKRAGGLAALALCRCLNDVSASSWL